MWANSTYCSLFLSGCQQQNRVLDYDNYLIHNLYFQVFLYVWHIITCISYKYSSATNLTIPMFTNGFGLFLRRSVSVIQFEDDHKHDNRNCSLGKGRLDSLLCPHPTFICLRCVNSLSGRHKFHENS
jgi:hypothetical protein